MRIHISLQLRWGDLDAYNHVNNVEVFRLLEEARVRAFWAPENPQEERPPTAVFERDSGLLSLIAGHRIEYLLPIDYRGTPLDVQIWLSRLGGASAEIGYEIRDDETLYACASSTLVFVDAASMRPRRIPDTVRAAWEPYLGDAVAFSQRG
ncbi:acyl-CoA thioester hydrolase [Homoserinimonas aerilata]|uniref:Acyl-CoA thioester hydrolase n=1 Tax=Homoserinimonas aerilata TaxID=1162970 RepID=A0A542YI09_9MICO|nr:thioesterase family protein [Homoserinimonas aerilata]TQL47712.1 acyl-CoA thioester hydrolase [Homoserinimonas aerilata]